MCFCLSEGSNPWSWTKPETPFMGWLSQQRSLCRELISLKWRAACSEIAKSTGTRFSRIGMNWGVATVHIVTRKWSVGDSQKIPRGDPFLSRHPENHCYVISIDDFEIDDPRSEEGERTSFPSPNGGWVCVLMYLKASRSFHKFRH